MWVRWNSYFRGRHQMTKWHKTSNGLHTECGLTIKATERVLHERQGLYRKDTQPMRGTYERCF